MDGAKLLHMAEQIARNLVVLGEEEAAAQTADHIIMFWDPRMKARILEEDRATMSPVVSKAVEQLAATLG